MPIKFNYLTILHLKKKNDEKVKIFYPIIENHREGILLILDILLYKIKEVVRSYEFLRV